MGHRQRELDGHRELENECEGTHYRDNETRDTDNKPGSNDTKMGERQIPCRVLTTQKWETEKENDVYYVYVYMET